LFQRRFLTTVVALSLSLWTAAPAAAAPGLTMQEARGLHAYLASQPDIAFHYIRDGCHARAHMMIRKMQALGIHAGKVWAFPRSDLEALQVDTCLVPAGRVRWCFHVAPVIRVHSGDHDLDMVIDPSLFERPVSVTDWAKVLRTTAGHLPFITQTAFGARPHLPNGKRAAGSYAPAGDPPNLDAAALATMMQYQEKQPALNSPVVLVVYPGVRLGSVPLPEKGGRYQRLNAH
jgi:hypothetical protein